MDTLSHFSHHRAVHYCGELSRRDCPRQSAYRPVHLHSLRVHRSLLAGLHFRGAQQDSRDSRLVYPVVYARWSLYKMSER